MFAPCFTEIGSFNERRRVMNDQMFDTFRKASESSVQLQQEMLKQWTQQWMSMPNQVPGTPAD